MDNRYMIPTEDGLVPGCESEGTCTGLPVWVASFILGVAAGGLAGIAWLGATTTKEVVSDKATTDALKAKILQYQKMEDDYLELQLEHRHLQHLLNVKERHAEAGE